MSATLALVKLELPPGALQVGTVYQAMGRWYRLNLVRWQMDGEVWALQPIGGWVARTVSAMTGKARAALAWRGASDTRFVAFGTEQKLYVLTQTADTPADITPAGFTAGDADATAGAGYGIGPFGEGAFGTPRVDNATYQEASQWTLDNFGELLLGCMAQDSHVYKWELDTGTPAVALGGDTPDGSAIVVTPERFLFVLGAGGDNRKVQWADQESLTTWTPSATNQAGDFNIESHGKLMCGKRIRGGTLLWTDQDVHLATYIGQPLVYRFDRVGENCGIISRGAAVAADTRAFWMGNGRFYVFDGGVRELLCDVADGVFGDLNTTQKSKITAHHEPRFSEIWWKYPSGSSNEIDRQVGYNYAGNFWLPHDDFARLSAAPRGVFANPIMADADGYIWDHETGADYDDAIPQAESGPYELGEGDRVLRARRLIGDEITSGDVRVSFMASDWPNSSETTYGPYTIANPVSIRFAARKARMKVEFFMPALNSRWGYPRVDVLAGGRR